MKYKKHALTFETQADILLNRGLMADRATLIERLSMVNYYRLSAYWYPFRMPNYSSDCLMPGTTLDLVWEHYVFDRQLRLVIIDAIERVEVAVRTQLVNLHTLEYGPFGYLSKNTLPGITTQNHQRLLNRLHTEEKSSRETYVAHYRTKYNHEKDLPLWMACELMTFGNLFTLFTGLKTKHKKTLSRYYGLNVPIFGSWLRTLNQVRNLCAHHARIWNRVYGVQAIIPSSTTNSIWTTPILVKGNQTFGVLTILKFLMQQIAPQSKWSNRLIALFNAHPEISLSCMGFPDNWMESAIWNNQPQVQHDTD